MNRSFSEELPAAWIRTLFHSDREGTATVPLPPAQRESALGWLQRSLVDFTSLERHIELLQELYGTKFPYPRPSHAGRFEHASVEESTVSGFTRSDKLADTRVTAILNQGVDTLTDAELSQLFLNPVALFDLFDVVDEVQPDHWMDVLHEFAVSTYSGLNERNRGAAARDFTSKPEPVSTSPEFWDRVRDVVGKEFPSAPATATSTSRSILEVFQVRSAVWVASLAACLLLGATVAWCFLPRGSGSDFNVLLAQASVKDVGARGAPGEGREVALKFDRKGYATMIAVFAGERPLVIPREMAIDSFGETFSPPLPDGLKSAKAILVVITEQPSLSLVEAILDGKSFGPNELDAMKSYLIDELKSKGFHWAATAQVDLSPKQLP